MQWQTFQALPFPNPRQPQNLRFELRITHCTQTVARGLAARCLRRIRRAEQGQPFLDAQEPVGGAHFLVGLFEVARADQRQRFAGQKGCFRAEVFGCNGRWRFSGAGGVRSVRGWRVRVWLVRKRGRGRAAACIIRALGPIRHGQRRKARRDAFAVDLAKPALRGPAIDRCVRHLQRVGNRAERFAGLGSAFGFGLQGGARGRVARAHRRGGHDVVIAWAAPALDSVSERVLERWPDRARRVAAGRGHRVQHAGL